jgi:hypothetical protein
MKTTEIRVRPVIRHVVTTFTPQSCGDGGSRAIGEFDSEAHAEEVAQALKEMHAPREYVMVQETPGLETPKVFYAYSEEEVAKFMIEPRTDDHGYKVYSRVMPTLQY